MTLIEAIRIARDESEWLAIDEDGLICAYEDRPYLCPSEKEWYTGWGLFNELGHYTGYPMHWEKTLIKLADIKIK